MARFLLKRLGLALITLAILSVVVFFMAQLLPGNVGRSILGPFADEQSVVALNKELGTDRPIVVQYLDWAGSALQGDLGQSLTYRAPVTDLVWDAFKRSFKLAMLAFLIVVPLAVFGGVISALHLGRPLDRAISVAGLSAIAVPEFVSGIVFIAVFGIWLGVLPVTATAPSDANPLEQIKYLIMPAMTLVLVLFGYIARMARAGTAEALEADYTRTAVLKGLPQRTVLRRHVLRNALLPTITVVATQTGYLIGGLVLVEVLFTYNGLGSLIYQAALQKDYPLLLGGVLVVGIVYLVATLLADLLYSLLNPRIRFGDES
jgi:peptide/nickel transport system permease protein